MGGKPSKCWIFLGMPQLSRTGKKPQKHGGTANALDPVDRIQKKGEPLMTIKKLLQGSIAPGLRSRVECGNETPSLGRYPMQALSTSHLPT